MTYNGGNKKIIASAQYTLIDVIDGKDGQDSNLFDGDFTYETKFWSTSQSSYNPFGTNVKVIASNQAIYGKNILEISNTQWVYSKNEISIEKDKIYKLNFRVRQTTDKTTGGSNIYAGAAVFNELGETVGTDGAGNMYFVVSAKTITVTNGWLTFIGYVSTKARDALVNTNGQQLFPAVRAFPSTAKTLKPMFIVNYNGGNGIAEVDGLILEDATEEWNRCKALSNKLDREWEDVFNTLTSDGKMQGMFLDENGHLYINGQYINAKKLSVTNSLGTKTLEVTHDGNININANSLSISSSKVATSSEMDTAINNITIGGRNLLLTSNMRHSPYLINASSAIRGLNIELYPDTNSFKLTCADINAENFYRFMNPDHNNLYDLEEGKSYTISGYIRGDSLGGRFVYRSESSNGFSWDFGNHVEDLVLENTFKFFKFTTKIPIGAKGHYISFQFYEPVVGGWIELKNIKFELGNKETDWTPAPEDVNNFIDNKVEKTEIISSINQTDESIKISANKIQLTGQVVCDAINGGSTEINGDKIKTGTLSANKITTGTLDANNVEIVNLNANNINSGQINGQRINAKNLSVANNLGVKTLEITSDGNVDINASNLKISNSQVTTNNNIISSINASNESITINASKINLTGVVTAKDLSGNGTTVINGSNITTGTLDASKVNVTNLNASNITSGKISSNRIDVTTLSVKGELLSGQINGIGGMKFAEGAVISSYDSHVSGFKGIKISAPSINLGDKVDIYTPTFIGSVTGKTSISSTSSTWSVSSSGALSCASLTASGQLKGSTLVTSSDTTVGGVLNVKNKAIYGMNNIALARGTIYLPQGGGNTTSDYLRIGYGFMACNDSGAFHFLTRNGAATKIYASNVSSTYSVEPNIVLSSNDSIFNEINSVNVIDTSEGLRLVSDDDAVILTSINTNKAVYKTYNETTDQEEINIDYTTAISTLWKAVQELKNENEKLKKYINSI